MWKIFARVDGNWTRAHGCRQASIGSLRRRQPAPANPPGEAKLVEPGRRVILDAQRQHFGLPGRGRQFVSIEQFKHGFDALGSFGTVIGAHPLPREQKALKVRERDRLDFRAQTVDRQAMNSSKQTAVAPFDFRRARVETAPENETLGFEREQRCLDVRRAGGSEYARARPL